MHTNQERKDSNQESIPHSLWGTKTEQVERSTMSSAAIDCERWVKAPGKGRGSPGQQIHTAEKALKGVAPWRIKDAFYGRAGSWGVKAYLELRDAYERWEAKERARHDAETRTAIDALRSQRERLSVEDPAGNKAHIDALDYALQRLG